MFQSEWFSLDLKSPQELLGGGAGDREEVFEALIKEKTRVDHLNVHQLLRRDLKVLPMALMQL